MIIFHRKIQSVHQKNLVAAFQHCVPFVVASMPSLVWEFYEKAEDPNYALCNFCKAKVSCKSGKPLNRQKIKTKNGFRKPDRHSG